jgi:hypothetical protein
MVLPLTTTSEAAAGITGKAWTAPWPPTPGQCRTWRPPVAADETLALAHAALAGQYAMRAT